MTGDFKPVALLGEFCGELKVELRGEVTLLTGMLQFFSRSESKLMVSVPNTSLIRDLFFDL